jgi:predicted acylesterase/phospholipase RssA
VIGQSFAIAQDAMSSLWKNAADVIVEPEVAGFAYDDFKRAGELMNAGEVAMRKALPEVRKWLEQPKEADVPAKVPAKVGRAVVRHAAVPAD